jgi:hypothetical protein
MNEILVGVLIFLCLVAASLGSLLIYTRLPERHREDSTSNVVRLVANIFVVMTSLVLGLMINSSKGTIDVIDRNVHVLATQLILLDRDLAQYGAAAGGARQHLAAYVEEAIAGTWPNEGPPRVADRDAERLLVAVGSSLNEIIPAGSDQIALWSTAQQQYQKVVEQRWVLVEQSEGSIPSALVVMLVAWLVLIFASFGYRAPRNIVVVGTFILSAALIAGTIYLILDMAVPFSGPIQVSPAPLARALAEMRG